MTDLLSEYFLSQLASIVHKAVIIVPDASIFTDKIRKITLDSNCVLTLTTNIASVQIVGIQQVYYNEHLFISTINSSVIMIDLNRYSVKLLSISDAIYLHRTGWYYKICCVNICGDLYMADPFTNIFTKTNHTNVVMVSFYEKDHYILNSMAQLIDFNTNKVITSDVLKINHYTLLQVDGDIFTRGLNMSSEMKLITTNCEDMTLMPLLGVLVTLHREQVACERSLDKSGVVRIFNDDGNLISHVNNISRISAISSNLIDKQGRILSYNYTKDGYITNDM